MSSIRATAAILGFGALAAALPQVTIEASAPAATSFPSVLVQRPPTELIDASAYRAKYDYDPSCVNAIVGPQEGEIFAATNSTPSGFGPTTPAWQACTVKATTPKHMNHVFSEEDLAVAKCMVNSIVATRQTPLGPILEDGQCIDIGFCGEASPDYVKKGGRLQAIQLYTPSDEDMADPRFHIPRWEQPDMGAMFGALEALVGNEFLTETLQYTGTDGEQHWNNMSPELMFVSYVGHGDKKSANGDQSEEMVSKGYTMKLNYVGQQGCDKKTWQAPAE